MKNFILIIQFLTRIPINISIDVKEEDFIKGVKFFPIVGLIIGIINALVYKGALLLLPSQIAIILTVLSNILITGALHIDGIADTCDGIFSARSKERMLEIMRDSRIGTNGAVAMFFDLALRIGILLSISEVQSIKVLVLSPILSRTFMVIVMYCSVYARAQGGLGNTFIGKVSFKDTLITVVIGVTLGFAILGYGVGIVIGVNLIVILLYKVYISSKIGGMTGDTLGASNEISEIVIFLVILIMERYMII